MGENMKIKFKQNRVFSTNGNDVVKVAAGDILQVGVDIPENLVKIYLDDIEVLGEQGASIWNWLLY